MRGCEGREGGREGGKGEKEGEQRKEGQEGGREKSRDEARARESIVGLLLFVIPLFWMMRAFSPAAI